MLGFPTPDEGPAEMLVHTSPHPPLSKQNGSFFFDNNLDSAAIAGIYDDIDFE